MAMRPDGFGCAACWPESADAAWTARGGLTQVHLVDESHYIVALLTCEACGQRFLSVMTEQIDWADGEDPVSRTMVPLAANEAAVFAANGVPSVAAIEAVGRGRRALRYEFPKDADAPTLFWGTGIVVGPHD